MSNINNNNSSFDDLKGIKRPKEAEDNLADKKGIKLFFGEAEARFFDQVGKELTNNILQESFILYRVDLKKTRTHALYGEAIVKETLQPIEVFGRINVEVESPTYRTPKGVTKKGMGEFKASMYLSHLEELGLLERDGNDLNIYIKQGDFLSHKGQFYEVWDDGYSQISNQFSYAGDRRAFLTIKAFEIDRDVFNGV